MTYFRFSTRDLLWAMGVVAMAAGWWADHRQARLEFEELKAWAPLKIRGTRHAKRRQMDEFERKFGKLPNPSE